MGKAFWSEVIGTLFLILTILFALLSDIGAYTSWLIGLILWGLVFVFGPVSGAQFNPAVSLSTHLKRWIGSQTTFQFIIAQLIAVLISYLLYNIYSIQFDRPFLIYPFKISLPMLLIGEFAGTFALISVILFTVKSKTHKAFSVYGFYIGFTVALFAFLFGKYSGGAFNPAVALFFGLTGLYERSEMIIAIGMQLIAAFAAYRLNKFIEYRTHRKA